MRWLLPWRTLEIETRLSPEEIVDALSPHLDPREPRLFGPRIDAAWIGRVNRKRLAMRRHIAHNNGCLPRIEATIDPMTRPDRELTDEELWAIVTFLSSLSSIVEITVPPDGGIPRAVPSGLDIDQPRFAPDTLD